MKNLVAFVIENEILSMVIGIIIILFLYFIIVNIKDRELHRYGLGESFWRKFGMLIMLTTFLLVILGLAQVMASPQLSENGNYIVGILSCIYFYISCKVTDNDLIDLIF